jgi:hypothetical protein
VGRQRGCVVAKRRGRGDGDPAQRLLHHDCWRTEISTAEVITSHRVDCGADLRFDSGLAAGGVIGTRSGGSAGARRVGTRVDTSGALSRWIVAPGRGPVQAPFATASA